MPSEAINALTRKEWRELGFYYSRDDVAKEWLLRGSVDGLTRFAQAVARYAANPHRAGLSEHEHFGPYSYLEVGTWHEPTITDHWIAGPQSHLAGLAHEMERRLAIAKVGSRLSFRAAFAPKAPYEFTLVVQGGEHDPAKDDPECW